jgi:hypothetical protein
MARAGRAAKLNGRAERREMRPPLERRPGNLSRRKMLKSFEGLRDLAFDHVVPCTNYAREEFFVPVAAVDAAVDEMIAACTKP